MKILKVSNESNQFLKIFSELRKKKTWDINLWYYTFIYHTELWENFLLSNLLSFQINYGALIKRQKMYVLKIDKKMCVLKIDKKMCVLKIKKK